MEIAKGIYNVGVTDKDIDLFEGLYTVPNGVLYNSYVVIDEKIAVFEDVFVGSGLNHRGVLGCPVGSHTNLHNVALGF